MDLSCAISQQQVDAFLQKHAQYLWEYWPVSCATMQNIKALRHAIKERIASAHDTWLQHGKSSAKMRRALKSYVNEQKLVTPPAATASKCTTM